MRGSKSLLLVSALSLLSATSQAIELVKKSNPAVVGFPIERKHVPNPVERDNARTRRKRDNSDNTVTQELDNEVWKTATPKLNLLLFLNAVSYVSVGDLG